MSLYFQIDYFCSFHLIHWRSSHQSSHQMFEKHHQLQKDLYQEFIKWLNKLMKIQNFICQHKFNIMGDSLLKWMSFIDNLCFYFVIFQFTFTSRPFLYHRHFLQINFLIYFLKSCFYNNDNNYEDGVDLLAQLIKS